MGAAGCDHGTGSYGKRQGPPPKVVSTSLDRFKVGGAEATNVPLHPLFVIRFSRPLASTSDSRPNFTITSGAVANVTFREIRVDPVEREVVFTIQDDLLPSTRYALHIDSSLDPANSLAAIDGARFEGPVDIPFTTEAALAPGEVAQTVIDPLAATVDPCSVVQTLAATCAGAQCHGKLQGSDTEPALPPAMGLNFASDLAIQQTAVDKASVIGGVEASPGGSGDPTTQSFPYGLPIIRSHQSSASFLLYKVLKRRPQDDPPPLPAPFDIADVADPGGLFEAELANVRGSGMPHVTLSPDGFAKPREALVWDDIRSIRAWIDLGAPPCTNPATP